MIQHLAADVVAGHFAGRLRQTHYLVQAEVGAHTVTELLVENGRSLQEAGHAQTQYLTASGHDYLLLAARPLKVIVLLTGAGIFQSQGAIKMVTAGRNIERLITIIHVRIGGIVDGVGHVNVNAAKSVNRADEGAKINGNIMIDGNTQIILHRLHGQRRAAGRIIAG